MGLQGMDPHMSTQRKYWSPELKERMSEAQNHRCPICGKQMGATGRRGDYPTFEHVIPLSAGGTDTEDNLAITCRDCNENRCQCGETTIEECAWRPTRHCGLWEFENGSA